MGFAETIHYYWTEMADPRTNDWFLIGSPVPVSIILFCYLYFVLRCGPRYMANKEPYSLKTFIKWYNIFQIIVNAWIIYAFLKAGWFTTITLGCEPVDYSMNPSAVYLTKIMWWIYIVKLIDLTETVVFILRKKNNQVSFLHLYHHVSTIMIIWLYTKYVPGGMATLAPLMNSFVHIVMYTYYYGSSHSSPTVRAFVRPIKRYITIIQMVQFVLLLIHSLQSISPHCKVPRLPGPVFISNLLMNFYLFYNFYKKNYNNKAKKE